VSKGVLKFGVYIYNKGVAFPGGIGGQDFRKKQSSCKILLMIIKVILSYSYNFILSEIYRSILLPFVISHKKI